MEKTDAIDHTPLK